MTCNQWSQWSPSLRHVVAHVFLTAEFEALDQDEMDEMDEAAVADSM